MTVCIDEAAECVNRESGEKLFVDGKNSPFLESVITFLQEYKTQTEAGIEQVNKLAEAGLLTEQKANFRINGDQTFDLAGFFTVDVEKFSKLTPELTFSLFQFSFTGYAQTQLSFGNRGEPFPQQQILGGGQMV